MEDLSEKALIRTSMRRLLSARVPAGQEAAVSARLSRFIQQFSPVVAMAAWVPFFRGEIDLAALLDEQLKVRPVFLPVTGPDGGMDLFKIGENWRAELLPGGYGIPEPSAKGARCGTEKLIALIPGLAFDRAGRRLGRGAGVYDRFLAGRGASDTVKVGVCWSEQLLPKVPTGEGDIGMDYICTEQEMICVENRSRSR